MKDILIGLEEDYGMSHLKVINRTAEANELELVSSCTTQA
jgi:hypothetical protein